MLHGSLCYPTNDRDDLGKMKPKADIRVFIGYSETSRGFRIYNRRTKRILETIHVKLDELTAIASEHDCLEPELQRFNNQNLSDNLMNTPSKEDLDNLFGPIFKDYFEQKSSDTTINSTAQPTHDQEDLPSTSSIIVDTHEAPPVFVPYDSLNHEEIESSTTNLEPLNVKNFYQVQPSTHIWTKDHPLDQVIGDLSKPVMTRQRLHTDSELSSWHNNNIEGEGDRVWHCQMRVVRALREQCRYRDLGVVCKQEASASVPWIYMAQFWHTLKEDGSKHQLNLGRRYARYSPVLVYTALHDVSKGLSQSSRDDISKNIFNSGRNKKIQGCLSSDRQSRSRLESNPRTPRTPSASRSPNPATKTAESSGPKRSTVIRFQLSSRQSARLTPPVPVPSAEKADEMIL
ncbi:hypothetical protein Tco_0925052 [Tanacetum coccineum]|uniref:Retroviral polymerase SH3-like domain-containing protein n=1 Tax=Tanacetum coccineum TaxID=301880 RepID=A0ABQ5D8J5_9ASTR